MVRWKFDGQEIERNPDRFIQRPKKKVDYRKIITGEQIRITPPRDKVSMYLEVGWTSLTETWRNKFYDWFMNDKKFTLQTHLNANPRDAWTVKIDEFNDTYKMTIGSQRWDVTMVLRVIDTVNDPILRQSYTSTPHLFVVQNNSNVFVHDAYVIVRPLDKLRVLNYENKVAGDLTVPHIAYVASDTNLVAATDQQWEEFKQEWYDLIESEDSSVFLAESQMNSVYGLAKTGDVAGGTGELNRQQVQFAFDLSEIGGSVNNAQFTIKSYGFGDDGSGNQIYGLEIYSWNYISQVWDLIVTSSNEDFEEISTNTSMFPEDIDFYVDNEEKMRFLVTTYQTGPNFESSIYIDSVEFSVGSRFMLEPSFTQTYLNLLKNPSFESDKEHWTDPSSSWSVDYVYYFEGDKCLKTYVLNEPIEQEVYCPQGEYLTVLWTVRGDKTGNNNVRLSLEYLDAESNVIGSYTDTRSANTNFQTFWFSTPSETPIGTTKVRFKIEKISGEQESDDSIYIDRLMLRLGSSEVEPQWSNHAHRTIKYNGVVEKDEVLRINLGARIADINGLQNVFKKIEGEWFTIPTGRSLIVFEEHPDSNHCAEAVIRFEEVSV